MEGFCILSDVARKVLTVLWNQNGYKEFGVNLKEISKKAQRTEQQIRDALNELYIEEFLLWDKKTNVFRLLYSREDEKYNWRR